MVMLTLSPSDSACRWVFYIWLKQILPALLWRVLHLVKSHYYGNVRVLEIMARWEQLDCFWHNSPTLSISSASSLSRSLHCNHPFSPSVSIPRTFSPWLTSLAKPLFLRHTCLSTAILSFLWNGGFCCGHIATMIAAHLLFFKAGNV